MFRNNGDASRRGVVCGLFAVFTAPVLATGCAPTPSRDPELFSAREDAELGRRAARRSRNLPPGARDPDFERDEAFRAVSGHEEEQVRANRQRRAEQERRARSGLTPLPDRPDSGAGGE
jgi:hypothetical protein